MVRKRKEADWFQRITDLFYSSQCHVMCWRRLFEMQWWIKNELISKQQHVFVNSKACVTNLLESSEFLTNSLARKRWVDLLFLDFEKAFDKVPHICILQKIKAYGQGCQIIFHFHTYTLSFVHFSVQIWQPCLWGIW